jgi:uncharacterized protein DUF547
MKCRRLIVVLLAAFGMAAPSAQDGSVDARRRNLDQVLDIYVRDGLVYYRALKSDRRLLDGYVNSLGDVSLATAGREEQMAFWLNAYNAIVLKTVIDSYPAAKRSNEYPARSIRQVPGAFETMKHQVAGRSLTLDQIEQTVLPGFSDPRVFLALGRGAVGSGRLRSEAYDPQSLEKQLSEAAAECATHSQCLVIDRTTAKMTVSSVFSWRSREFASAYTEKASSVFSTRSPIERAVIAFVEPKLTAIEKEFLAKNDFKIEFSKFDWSLNDLTGR